MGPLLTKSIFNEMSWLNRFKFFIDWPEKRNKGFTGKTFHYQSDQNSCLVLITIKILSIGTDRSEQTVQIQEQSDQDLH